MSYFWTLATILWLVLGAISGDPAYFACMYGCLIYAKLCEKEKE